jgi:hypothetical protein
MSHAKPVDERSGHRTAPAVIEGATALVAPDLPAHIASIPRDLRARWEAVWTAPVAQVLDPVSDLEPMARLFELYALDRKMAGAVNKQLEWLENYSEMPFDPQFARVRLAVAAEIRQLEQTLGITPRGRLVIGAAVVAAGKAQQTEVHDDAED